MEKSIKCKFARDVYVLFAAGLSMLVSEVVYTSSIHRLGPTFGFPRYSFSEISFFVAVMCITLVLSFLVFGFILGFIDRRILNVLRKDILYPIKMLLCLIPSFYVFWILLYTTNNLVGDDIFTILLSLLSIPPGSYFLFSGSFFLIKYILFKENAISVLKKFIKFSVLSTASLILTFLLVITNLFLLLPESIEILLILPFVVFLILSRLSSILMPSSLLSGDWSENILLGLLFHLINHNLLYMVPAT